MSTRPDVAAIKARAEAADLPKLNAYTRMQLSSPGVRPPLEHRRVVETVELLDAPRIVDRLNEGVISGTNEASMRGQRERSEGT